MNLSQQLTVSLLHSPLSILKVKGRSIMWLLLYVGVGFGVFYLFSEFLISNQQVMKQALLDYIFPQSWHQLTEPLLLYFYESQAKVVIGNTILGASLVIASIFLFPIKEMASASFERDISGEIPQDQMRWRDQILEEGKLLLLYLTAQLVILWMGYYPYKITVYASVTLSYVFLFLTFAIDFISPTLQRHSIDYAKILKSLFKRPLLLLCFGALYCLPGIVSAHILFKLEDLNLVDVAQQLFIINLIFLTLAIPAGTHVAIRVIQDIKSTSSWSKKVIKRCYMTLALTCLIFGYLHLALMQSLHHKSQILKAEYDIEWNSFDSALPSLSALLNGKALTSVSINLIIKNPTQIPIVLEDSNIVFSKFDKTVADIAIQGFQINAGEEKRIPIKLDSLTDLSQLSELSTLLEGWHANLQMQVWPGIPFVVNLLESNPEKVDE